MSDHAHFPPKVPLPGPVATALFVSGGSRLTARLRRRYGRVVTVNIAGLGEGVAVADPALVKRVFTAKPEVVSGGGTWAPLAHTLGQRSPFALDRDEHLQQRRLLLPPFHGERMASYASIFEEETLREIATWPEDCDVPTLDGMSRITLNAILRAVFGAQDDEFDELLELLPPWVKLGSFLTTAPWLRKDLGPWSPWRRFLGYRARYEAIVDRLIDQGRRDPRLAERTDVLALLLQARYDDGEPMSRQELADVLLSLLVAGHETTAGTLAWSVERLRRHPQILRRLEREIEEGGKELREATIHELQRTRSVIGGALRKVVAPFQLGDWLLQPGTMILVDGFALHSDPELFPEPYRFNPDRFLGVKPDTYAWVPFGGGRRRCVGAAFAQLEMDVVLRTLLQHVELVATSERDERWRFRGVAFAPSRGGVARIRRRPEPLRVHADAPVGEAVAA